MSLIRQQKKTKAPLRPNLQQINTKRKETREKPHVNSPAGVFFYPEIHIYSSSLFLW